MAGKTHQVSCWQHGSGRNPQGQLYHAPTALPTLLLCVPQSLHLFIPGVNNVGADALSRNNTNLFFLLSPKASASPIEIPQALWEAVVETKPDWLSPCWRANWAKEYLKNGIAANTQRSSKVLSLKVCPATIKVYLAAVCNLHIESSLPDPFETSSLLPRLVRGIKRVYGQERRPRLPITPQLLQRFKEKLHLQWHNHFILWSAMLIAFFLFPSFIRATGTPQKWYNSYGLNRPNTHIWGLPPLIKDWPFSSQYSYLCCPKQPPYPVSCKGHTSAAQSSLSTTPKLSASPMGIRHHSKQAVLWQHNQVAGAQLRPGWLSIFNT